MSARGVVLLTLLLGLPAIAGCIGDGGTDPPDPRSTPPTEEGSKVEGDSSGDDRQAEEGSEETTREASNGGEWNVTESTRAAWIVGAGAGGSAGGGLMPDDACPSLLIGVAHNATQLVIHVTSEVVNASQPGVGAGQVRLVSPAGESHDSGPIVRASLSMTFDEPASGSWGFELRPVGLVVNQTWSVIVSLSGHGGTTTPLTLQHVCAGG